MRKVAFVTYNDIPDLTVDDQLASDYLRRVGVDSHAVIWDSLNVRWEEFDLVILRSCWEYHLRTEEFRDWVARMEERNVPLWNPPRVIRWNMDKSYLRELAAEGVNIAPTLWLDKDSDVNLNEILEENRWMEAVIKPTVSMSAYQTSFTSLSRAFSDEIAIHEILKRSGAIIQKFIPEVRTNGEWSFIFFGEQYSHAVLKRPKAGDFRVQSELGGRLDQVAPSPVLIAQAQRIVRHVKEPLLYARVDAVEADGELVLMELELIDPVLFLASDHHAAQRFAETIVALNRQGVAKGN